MSDNNTAKSLLALAKAYHIADQHSIAMWPVPDANRISIDFGSLDLDMRDGKNRPFSLEEGLRDLDWFRCFQSMAGGFDGIYVELTPAYQNLINRFYSEARAIDERFAYAIDQTATYQARARDCLPKSYSKHILFGKNRLEEICRINQMTKLILGDEYAIPDEWTILSEARKYFKAGRLASAAEVGGVIGLLSSGLIHAANPKMSDLYFYTGALCGCIAITGFGFAMMFIGDYRKERVNIIATASAADRVLAHKAVRKSLRDDGSCKPATLSWQDCQ